LGAVATTFDPLGDFRTCGCKQFDPDTGQTEV
jgi:hypothetical protein